VTSAKTGVAPGYLHGFTKEEQDRLYRQARFLERSIYAHVDYSKRSRLLEVGCGVGAQTEILLERFPNLTIDGIDAAAAQIGRAKERLATSVKGGRARFHVGDALHLPFAESTFDSAFVCWFLEHVQAPVEILKEIRRTLVAGAVIYCTEVQNASFYVHPYSPATLQYWFAFNDHQWTLKGDPFVGAKLGNYLLSAGYQNIETRVGVEHYDSRAPKHRAQFIEYWTSLLLSGAPGLLDAGRITPEIVEEMKRELEIVKHDPDAVFFYAWFQAKAEAF
jgi:ubiquinone/menaquinone biosynthesis C-methylase UbiE